MPGAANRVMDHMERELLTISPVDSCERALAVMEAAGVGDLPVLEGDRLVGMVSELDIRRFVPRETDVDGDRDGPDPLLRHIKVAGVMSYAPPTIRPTAPLVDAAALMHQRAVTNVPVVEHGQLVGIVTVRTILAALIGLLSRG